MSRNEDRAASPQIELVRVRTNAVALRWPHIPGAVRYNVYRCEPESRDEKARNLRFLRIVSEPYYEDRSAAPNRKYQYSVRNGDAQGVYGRALPPIDVSTPPLPPIMRYAEDLSRLPYLDGAESGDSPREPVTELTKRLAKYDVISFDVFDTLLLRPFAKPSDLFMLVGHKLGIYRFNELRVNAERQAREYALLTRGNREVTIGEIYRLLEQETGVEAQTGAQAEFETELDLCTANPYFAAVFDLLRNMGKTLIAVSDMYYPQDLLKQLLTKCGFSGFDRVFVSCDYHCAKTGGELFQEVTNAYLGRSVHHLGDNYKADVEGARAQGLTATHYPSVGERGNPYRPTGMTALVGSAYAGIVNNHLHNGVHTYSPYYEYGFLYAGLHVLGFCAWVHDNALRYGADKILFPARDGDIYSRVYNMLYGDIPWEYFYWSRVAGIVAASPRDRAPYLHQLVLRRSRENHPPRLDDLLEQLGVGPLDKYLPDYSLPPEVLLRPGNVKMVCSLLADHWEEALECLSAVCGSLKAYAKRAVDGCRNVIVADVGWSGDNVLSLKTLVEGDPECACRIHCLLAASQSATGTDIAAKLLDRQVETYHFSPIQNKHLHDFHVYTNQGLNNVFFEMLVQSNTPSFLKIENTSFIFDSPEVENYGRNREIHQGIVDFARIYSRTFEQYPYVMNIPGHDAYMPFRMLIKDLSFLREYFHDYVFRMMGYDAEMSTIQEIIHQREQRK